MSSNLISPGACDATRHVLTRCNQIHHDFSDGRKIPDCAGIEFDRWILRSGFYHSGKPPVPPMRVRGRKKRDVVQTSKFSHRQRRQGAFRSRGYLNSGRSAGMAGIGGGEESNLECSESNLRTGGPEKSPQFRAKANQDHTRANPRVWVGTMKERDLFYNETPDIRVLDLLRLVIESNQRQLSFLVDRNEQFARGWGIALPRAFYSALDIQETTFVEKLPSGGTKKSLRLTQGKNFSFASQDTIYDLPGAYSGKWSDCLQAFQYRIEVIRATSAGSGFPGRVEYTVSRNQTQKPGPMAEIESFSCSQYEFVRRLIIGMPALLDNEAIY